MEIDFFDKLEQIEAERVVKIGKLADLIVDEILKIEIDIKRSDYTGKSVQDLLIEVKKYQNKEKYKNVVSPGEYQLIRYALGQHGIIVFNGEEVAFCRSGKMTRLIGFKDWPNVFKMHENYIEMNKPVYVNGKTFRLIVIAGKLFIDNRF